MGMIHLFFIFLAALNFSASADMASITDSCRDSAFEELVKDGQKKFPRLSALEIEEKIKTGISNPSAHYMMETIMQVCIVNHVKKDLLAGSIPSEHCPGVKSQYKINCFKEWVARQKIGNTTAAVLMLTAGTEIAKQDKKNASLVKQSVLPMLFDALLLTLETYSTANNTIFTPGPPADAKEQLLLQGMERDLFDKARTKLISTVTSSIRDAKADAARMPASSGAMKKWLDAYFKSLEERMEKLKKKKL